MSAPHLPKKASPKESRMLVWSLVIVFLAFLASIAGTLATVAWIAPAGNERVILSTLRPPILDQDATTTFDPFIEQQVRQRMVFVYDKRKKTNSGAYLDGAYVAPAAVLNAQGWAVISLPPYLRGTERNWEIVTSQGDTYRVSRAIKDNASSLVFLKIEAEDFRGDIAFIDWEETDIATTPLFAFNRGQILHAVVRHDGVDTNGTKKLWQVDSPYTIISDAQPGSLVVNDAGNVVGFIHDDGSLVEGWLIAMQLRTLFEDQTLAYNGINVSGQHVDAFTVGDDVRQQAAFYISQSPSRATSSTLARGDVITHVNGSPFDPSTVSRDILLETGSIMFDIIRAGEIAHVDVARTPVRP